MYPPAMTLETCVQINQIAAAIRNQVADMPSFQGVLVMVSPMPDAKVKKRNVSAQATTAPPRTAGQSM